MSSFSSLPHFFPFEKKLNKEESGRSETYYHVSGDDILQGKKRDIVSLRKGPNELKGITEQLMVPIKGIFSANNLFELNNEEIYLFRFVFLRETNQ